MAYLLDDYLNPYNSGNNDDYNSNPDLYDKGSESWSIENPRPSSQWQTANAAPRPSTTPAPSNRPASGSHEDLVKNYWAPDRRQAIIRELQQNYHAPDREQNIAYWQNLPETQLWPNGMPQGSQSGSGGGPRWDMNYFVQNFGEPKTPQELLALESKIAQMGGKVLRNAAGIAGKIQTPDGRIIDVIKAAGLGGQGFQWLEGGGNIPGGGEFSDPYGSQMEQLIAERLAGLMSEPNRAAFNEYMSRLLSAEKNKQANTENFVKSLRGRIEELNKYPYTSGDEAVIRAKALDQLERRRQQTLKNEQEQIYARGWAPTSGNVKQASDEINNRFEGVRTGIESDLTQAAISEQQRRKDEALGLEQLVEQALSGADLSSLQFLASRAQGEEGVYQEMQNRWREAIATAGIPEEMMMNRAQLANQTAGLGGNPQSVMSSILGLLSMGQQGRGIQAAQNANNMAGIGNLLAILFPRNR